jgi:hypothetical protein
MYAAGLTDAINKHLEASGGAGAGGGGGDLSGFSGGGTSGANQALGRKMMLAAGYGEDQWPALKALWTGESNWSNTVVNPSSGAGGIPQALPATKMGPKGAGEPPATQIAWGLKYIKDRYGSPAAALSAWQGRSPHWYATGGRLGQDVPDWGGWNAKGADVTVNRPTIFGAGEAGPERVSITPKGSGGGAGRGRRVTVRPVIERGAIVIHAGAADATEVQRLVRTELDRFATQIAAELDGLGDEDDAEMMV